MQCSEAERSIRQDLYMNYAFRKNINQNIDIRQAADGKHMLDRSDKIFAFLIESH